MREPTLGVMTIGLADEQPGRLARSTGKLCCGISGNIPSREDQDRRVALQGSREALGLLDPKSDAIILNSGEGCLRNASQPGQVILTVPLQFSNDANRFPHGYLDPFSRRTKRLHFKASDSHVA